MLADCGDSSVAGSIVCNPGWVWCKILSSFILFIFIFKILNNQCNYWFLVEKKCFMMEQSNLLLYLKKRFACNVTHINE